VGIKSWLFGHGLAGAISKDLCTKYLSFKNRYPNDNESKILERVWQYWLALNEEAIMTEDGIDKRVRLKVIKDKNEGTDSSGLTRSFNNLLEVYTDVLYIETEISSRDLKLYDDAIKVFVKTARKLDLDFLEDYNNIIIAMKRLSLRK